MASSEALLAALGLFKALDPRVSVNEILAFLHICRTEGSSVQAVAEAAGLTQSTASRSLRVLGPPESAWAQPPALGLVEAFLAPDDARSHVIHLTPAGRALRDRLDALLAPGSRAPAQGPGERELIVTP